MTSPDYLRIGDAERDAMTSSLHEHFAQGRLTPEELDERLSATLEARTFGDLRKIDHDLPKPPPPAPVYPQGGRGMARPRPRFFVGFPLLAIVVIAMAAASHTWEFFAVGRVILVLWLLMMIFGFRRAHRRWHHHHH